VCKKEQRQQQSTGPPHRAEAKQRARLLSASYARLQLFLVGHIIRCVFYKHKGQAPALGNFVYSPNKK